MYNADFGAGRTVNLHVFATNVFAQQSFRLGKDWTADLSGFYASPSIWQGTFKTHSIGNLDAGVQKAIWKSKGIIKLSVSDVFHTLHWTGVSDFAGQYVRSTGHTESRQLKLYFTYKFGNSQVKTTRARKSAAEEESKRVSTQSSGLSN
jgi:hypothetical protein